jgi:hypothetical protein
MLLWSPVGQGGEDNGRKYDVLGGEGGGVIERMTGKAKRARKVHRRKGLRKEWDDEGTLGASLGSLRKGYRRTPFVTE